MKPGFVFRGGVGREKDRERELERQRRLGSVFNFVPTILGLSATAANLNSKLL